MGLTPEEKEALIKAVGGKFIDICKNGKLNLSLSYHRVKGKEYPALVVHCNGKRRKIHINQAEWKVFMEEKRRVMLRKILKYIKQIEKIDLLPENASDLWEVLRELKDILENRKYWEFLFRNREHVPQVLPHWKFEYQGNLVEIWDLAGIKELKIVITINSLTGKKQIIETIKYKCKENKIYILSLKPYSVLKIEREEIIKRFIPENK